MRMLWAAPVVGGMALATACGGALCEADLSSAEGEWTFTFTDDDGDQTVVHLTISADGTVDVRPEDGNEDIDCDVVRDDFCDLEVACQFEDGSNAFSFTIVQE